MYRAVRLFLLFFALSFAWALPAAGQEVDAAVAGVFQLITVTGPSFRGVESGTAFFIRPEGVALTNSHVIYQALRDPLRFQLMALIGKEFYSAEILCANPLPYDPTDSNAEAVLGRDIAVIQVLPSRFHFRLWGSAREEGPQYAEHAGQLPLFSWLVLGADPAPGEPIRVVGYGFLPAAITFGERWTTSGTVNEVGTARDGTAVFRVASTNRPRPGNSGSPVLDSQNRVVGMWTWNEAHSFAFGAAISSSALNQGCR